MRKTFGCTFSCLNTQKRERNDSDNPFSLGLWETLLLFMHSGKHGNKKRFAGVWESRRTTLCIVNGKMFMIGVCVLLNQPMIDALFRSIRWKWIEKKRYSAVLSRRLSWPAFGIGMQALFFIFLKWREENVKWERNRIVKRVLNYVWTSFLLHLVKGRKRSHVMACSFCVLKWWKIRWNFGVIPFAWKLDSRLRTRGHRKWTLQSLSGDG